MTLTPEGTRWHCFGCGATGDAIDFVRRLNPALTFPDAVAHLTGGPTLSGPGKAPGKPASKPAPEDPPGPSGLPEAAALALVEAAECRLWLPEGARALAYLTGPRCLAPETIRAARLGWTPEVWVPNRDGDKRFPVSGWVIPWFDGDQLAKVNVRQPEGRKYMEAFRDPARLVCYPGPATVRAASPLIVVEGELDALALGEALGDLAAVVTLGSASNGPTAAVLWRILSALGWYAAHDADTAGDKAAAAWPARARRVRPPVGKDWTDAKAAGVDLARWGATSWPGWNAPRCSHGKNCRPGDGVARMKPPASTTPAAGRVSKPWPPRGRGTSTASRSRRGPTRHGAVRPAGADDGPRRPMKRPPPGSRDAGRGRVDRRAAALRRATVPTVYREGNER